MEESLQLRSMIQSFLQTQREEQAIIESAFKDVRKSLAALQSAFALAGETVVRNIETIQNSIDEEMENDACKVFDKLPRRIPTEFQQHELMDSACYASDEIAEQNPTELQSIDKCPEATFVSAAIFTTAKAGNYLFEEAGEPHLLTMARLKAVRHLFDEMPELTSVEQDKECELNISHLMLVPRLDIEFLLGAISRFVFDPGGSFWYHKGCHSFKSGGDKYDFDFCFGELNTGPGCTSIDNALKMESIVVSSSCSKTRLHVAATGYPILYLSHVQTKWPTEEQPCVVSYIFYSCICRFQDKDSGTIVASTYVDLIVAYISHERLMLPVVDYQRVWCLIKMFTASKTSKVFVRKSLARALSYASMPIGDILVSPEDVDVVYSQSNKFGSFSHGSTYSGYHVSCAFSIIAKFGPNVSTSDMLLEGGMTKTPAIPSDKMLDSVSNQQELPAIHTFGEPYVAPSWENFVWKPGLCVIFFMHTILGDKDVFEGKEERWEAKKIMGYDNGLSRLSRDNGIRRLH